tara:strand:+ start:171 stop:476 length:306 start_codon:yes stop_codon:yes gene_type:complete
MKTRFYHIANLTPYCGVYKNKEEFYSTVLNDYPQLNRNDLTYGIQYIQVRNKNGVPCEYYNEETHQEVGLTAFLSPNGEFILLEGIYQQSQASIGYLKLVA